MEIGRAPSVNGLFKFLKGRCDDEADPYGRPV